ncbi:hypothetical protein AVEN_257850-1 [Araneus ventricosus]|uniref:Uncharacterized protein n=1 Tax=Araneus ventricosus TaxID=182803 RepID=A0A4Y2EGZ7_ARAVE|nr:hypothetical protein AVEN_257850-1 [Araneus ventricosus]
MAMMAEKINNLLRASESSTLESEPQLTRRSSTFDSSEEMLTPPQFDSSRTGLTTKLPCGRSCNKALKRRRKQETTRKKPDPVIYKDSKRSSLTKNGTSVDFPKKKRTKYSRKYDPTGMPEDNGFVPVPGPYGGKTTQRSAQRRARTRNPDELWTKESRAKPNILGNGNFEIISGGIFSDDESNEIGDGRRVGRGYEGYGVPQFQRIPLNAQNFQFPSFYQGQLQIPARQLVFPRATY